MPAKPKPKGVSRAYKPKPRAARKADKMSKRIRSGVVPSTGIRG